MNESSYVVKVDASTVGYGNQSGSCMLYKVKWIVKVRERDNNLMYDDPMYRGQVSTTVLSGSSVEGTYQQANRPKGLKDRRTGDG